MIVEKTETFDKWLKALRDEIGKAHIIRRIQRIETEDFLATINFWKIAGFMNFALIMVMAIGFILKNAPITQLYLYFGAEERQTRNGT